MLSFERILGSGMIKDLGYLQRFPGSGGRVAGPATGGENTPVGVVMTRRAVLKREALVLCVRLRIIDLPVAFPAGHLFVPAGQLELCTPVIKLRGGILPA
jgi:hypothetical protein